MNNKKGEGIGEEKKPHRFFPLLWDGTDKRGHNELSVCPSLHTRIHIDLPLPPFLHYFLVITILEASIHFVASHQAVEVPSLAWMADLIFVLCFTVVVSLAVCVCSKPKC